MHSFSLVFLVHVFLDCINSVIHVSEGMFVKVLLIYTGFCVPIKRYRYCEAYQVDLRLKSLEEEFIAKNSVSEEVLCRMRSVSGWRAGLIVSGLTVDTLQVNVLQT